MDLQWRRPWACDFENENDHHHLEKLCKYSILHVRVEKDTWNVIMYCQSVLGDKQKIEILEVHWRSSWTWGLSQVLRSASVDGASAMDKCKPGTIGVNKTRIQSAWECQGCTDAVRAQHGQQHDPAKQRFQAKMLLDQDRATWNQCQAANEIHGELVAGSAKYSIIDVKWKHNEVMAIAVDKDWAVRIDRVKLGLINQDLP